MGGWSPEREVSLSSGYECAKALADRGYKVRVIDVGRDVPALLRALDPRPDVIFNALHGIGGEDGTIQGVFEMLGIPYTHSGVLASALAMHKPTAKAIFHGAGLPIVEGLVARTDELALRDPMPAPFVVKPTNQGSSVGVRIVRVNDNSWREEVTGWCFGNEVMVERFVPGRELTVAVMGDRALGVCEIVPRGSFMTTRQNMQWADPIIGHLPRSPQKRMSGRSILPCAPTGCSAAGASVGPICAMTTRRRSQASSICWK